MLGPIWHRCRQIGLCKSIPRQFKFNLLHFHFSQSPGLGVIELDSGEKVLVVVGGKNLQGTVDFQDWVTFYYINTDTWEAKPASMSFPGKVNT